MKVVGISGSPVRPSRSAALLKAALRVAGSSVPNTAEIQVADLPPHALMHAQAQDTTIALALSRVVQADLVIVATPIYKAAYSGLLKTFLDLLPPDALRGKTVLPLATGGSTAHLLALDYALKPVLSALGARHMLDPVFATDAQFVADPVHGWQADDTVVERLQRALQVLDDRLGPRPRLADAPLPELGAAEPVARLDEVLSRVAAVPARSSLPAAC